MSNSVFVSFIDLVRLNSEPRMGISPRKRHLTHGLDLVVLHEATYDHGFAVGRDHHRLGGACGENRQLKPFRNLDFIAGCFGNFWEKGQFNQAMRGDVRCDAETDADGFVLILGNLRRPLRS